MSSSLFLEREPKPGRPERAVNPVTRRGRGHCIEALWGRWRSALETILQPPVRETALLGFSEAPAVRPRHLDCPFLMGRHGSHEAPSTSTSVVAGLASPACRRHSRIGVGMKDRSRSRPSPIAFLVSDNSASEL